MAPLLFSRGFSCFRCVRGVLARGALRSSFLPGRSLRVRFFRWPSIGMEGVVNDLIVPDTGEVEDGIVDIISGLRGSQAGGSAGGYVRYAGRRVFVEGGVLPVVPAGTIRDPVLSYLLDEDVVDDGSWAALPRAGLGWEDVRELGRWDTRQVPEAASLRPSYAEEICRRFVDASRCRYQIPGTVRCDRTFLVDAVDGLYVKKTSAWLFDGVGRFPVMSSGSVRNVVVEERLHREWKTAFSLLVGSGRVISFADYTCFRGLHAHDTDVRFCGRFEGRTTTLVPFYDFPAVPSVVSGLFPPLSLSVRLPRVAFYFGQVVLSASGVIRKRYESAYVIEWAYAVAAALGLEWGAFRRVWVCDEECLAFLRKFVGFPDFFVDLVDHSVIKVSFNSLVEVLAKARLLSTEYVHSRVDYATRKRSSWVVVREGTLEFVEVEARVSHVAPPSCEVLRMTLWDEVVRQSSEWSDALTGVPERADGCSVRELLEVLTERVNRYWRERESPELEVERLRDRLSADGRYDRGVKRNRDADDEGRFGARTWGAREPYDPYDPYSRAGGPSSG